VADARLAGRTAVVTGGASGLGLAIARRFAGAGAAVVITDINDDAGQAAADSLGARFVRQDVTDESQWEDLFASLRDSGQAADILVNNAGYADAGLGQLLEDIDIGEAKRIFEVNFDGTLLGCKHAIRNMKERGGNIINMSSIGGRILVDGGMMLYPGFAEGG